MISKPLKYKIYFKILKENLIDDIIKNNSYDNIFNRLSQSPNNNNIISCKSPNNKNIGNVNVDNNEFSTLLNKQIQNQDSAVENLKLIAKNIKKSNLEIQNELKNQNEYIKNLDKNVISFYSIYFY